MTTMTDARHLTIREIAEREHIHPDTVKRAINNGHLRAHRVGTRGDWRIAVEDYEAWLANGAQTTKQETT
jgi:excisionase family DNA binding protein